MDLKKVIDNNYCIGCGICVVVSEQLSINLNSIGQFEAKIESPYLDKSLDKVCPFTNSSLNEDKLSSLLFDSKNKYQENIGYYLSNYAGYVKDEKQRESSSSGGVLSWLLIQLLKNKDIDGVIHVGDFLENKNVLMGYRISFSTEEILQNRKSRYYPIEMSDVLKTIKKKYPTKKFAIVGIPCFIKAVRLLQLNDDFYKYQIKFTIGIVCGHLKSKFFAESYALELGVYSNNLQSIDFRFFQDTDETASNYSVKIESKIPKNQMIKNNSDFYASDWGHGMFKYKACDFCDDVLAETSDIVFGDAWLSKFNGDARGTNIITVRNQYLNELLLNNNNEIHLEDLEAEEILLSQNAGIRHRTEGLKYRLYKNKSNWIPQKRVNPESNKLDKNRKLIYDVRYQISIKSNLYFSKVVDQDGFMNFKKKMNPLLNKYNELYFPKKDDQNKLLFLKKIYWKLSDKFINK